MTERFVRRLVGAAKLDSATFDEVEADRTATPQALAVVVFSSLAAAIGARGASGGAATLAFFLTSTAIVLMLWAAFALLTFEVGARILPTKETHVNMGELLRTLGFAAAPGLIQVFGIVPGAKVPVFTVAITLALAASVIAVRESLKYHSTGRALAVCTLGLLLSMAIAITLGLLFGPSLSGS